MKINWNISKLECKTSENGLYNVVYKVHWICTTSTNNNGIEYTTEINSSTNLPSPDTNNFIPYESLTKERVIDWLLDTLTESDIQKIQEILQYNLDEQINPSIVSLNLPWG